MTTSNQTQTAVTLSEATADNPLSSFNLDGSPLRVATIDGVAWFSAADTCETLGYANASKAVADHCRAGGITKRYTPTNSGVQEMLFISESNLYRLCVKSHKPEAEKFEAWVFEDVLPSIRKTGAYIDQTERHMTHPVFLELKRKAFEAYQSEMKTRLNNGMGLYVHKKLPALTYKDIEAVLDEVKTYLTGDLSVDGEPKKVGAKKKKAYVATFTKKGMSEKEARESYRMLYKHNSNPPETVEEYINRVGDTFLPEVDDDESMLP